MRWLFGAIEELLPVIVFFVVAQQVDFKTGIISMTGILIVLLTYTWLTRNTVPRFALISTITFLIFAVPSIVTDNNVYFQISDTVLDGAFSLLLLGGWLLGVPVLKYFFGSVFAISERAWHLLALRWGLLFLCLALLNEWIRQMYSEDVWSLYKLLSTIGIMLFGIYQFKLSHQERILGESNILGLRK